MKFYRIWALVKRNIRLTFRGLDPLVDFFYWPFYDIILWGFTSRWIQPCNTVHSDIRLTLLAGLVLWQAAYRANLDISFNLLSELWSRNVINLFATPITIGEWMSAVMLLGLFNTCIAVTFAMFAVWILYGITIPSLGWVLLPMFMSLLISGWAIGLITASCIVYKGQRVQKLVWVMGWFFSPLSAVFYPLAVLPDWVQSISRLLPMTYIFEGLRLFTATHTFPLSYFVISLALNSIYLSLALFIFRTMFEKSRSKGLARLESE